jgi:hypothetical protein
MPKARDEQQDEILVRILSEIYAITEYLSHARSSVVTARELLKKLDNKNQAGSLFMLLQHVEKGIALADDNCTLIGQERR